ncbi:MAG: hypothetical protein ABH864_01820 [archaeon]
MSRLERRGVYAKDEGQEVAPPGSRPVGGSAPIGRGCMDETLAALERVCAGLGMSDEGPREGAYEAPKNYDQPDERREK